MYECFYCRTRSVVWDADYSYNDYGLDGNGIVQECHCSNCGAKITYWIDLDEDEVREESLSQDSCSLGLTNDSALL